MGTPTLFTLNITIDMPEQTVWMQIIVFLEQQFDHGLHSLSFTWHFGIEMDLFKFLALVMLNKLRCHAHF